jgi:N-acetylmuramoyl-L-alanine amidase CwlA
MRELKQIILHHTGGLAGKFDSPWLIDWRHRHLRGWDEIGYHFLIGAGWLTIEGQIYAGRSIEKEGAHARGCNGDSIGVALIGNFNRGAPAQKQIKSLVRLIAELCEKYRIPIHGIYGHNEKYSTNCPGRYVDMREIRMLVGIEMTRSIMESPNK